ncbi:quorum-sensing autoinducer CAI-1 synthase [Vibrio sp. MarTm2]|uniref:alpha-hydroxyketone-type quorum-sensing autoinducer synthase n=1 Tax=Vibrio sp. MarTm2 TaxID=2998831 RepID=UPI0022CD611A|nr:alpha-hydroxyketone-type quorum-sensing autoinducer synthase [Vibrio sp. MarTm2]MDA0130370.1 quorum-sensing autoinducer CAI-1 synthase [Vibrio sp. MarTm2]
MNTLNLCPPSPEFINKKIEHHLAKLVNCHQNGKHLVMGAQPNDDDIVLQSNDYLDLANHPEIIHRHAEAILEKRHTSVMSGVFLQSEDRKPALERKLADYTGFSSCLLSQSGWSANLALLQTICDSETQVYIDFFAHMSLWEGARIAGANIHPFMHNNVRHLQKLIRRHGPGLVLIDSVYSTIGTVAPLIDIVLMSKENGCALVIDESHSLGTHGKHGEGLLKSLKLSHQVDFMTASLAKAFAYRAGAIWCNNRANECIPFVGYPAVFSSAMLPYEIERLDKTLEIIRQSDHQREHLRKISRYLKQQLTQIGVTIRSESQIVTLETGDERNTENVRDFLESKHVFGAVFCQPATTPNKNIIRFSLNSSATQQQLDQIIAAVQSARQQPNLYIL